MIRWWLLRLGYAVRPYDMMADRRRWRWQPAQQCSRAMIENDAEMRPHPAIPYALFALGLPMLILAVLIATVVTT